DEVAHQERDRERPWREKYAGVKPEPQKSCSLKGARRAERIDTHIASRSRHLVPTIGRRIGQSFRECLTRVGVATDNLQPSQAVTKESGAYKLTRKTFNRRVKPIEQNAIVSEWRWRPTHHANDKRRYHHV
ncbi:unnamed protein product, partial [Sphacelaria rigidula]